MILSNIRRWLLWSQRGYYFCSGILVVEWDKGILSPLSTYFQKLNIDPCKSCQNLTFSNSSGLGFALNAKKLHSNRRRVLHRFRKSTKSLLEKSRWTRWTILRKDASFFTLKIVNNDLAFSYFELVFRILNVVQV